MPPPLPPNAWPSSPSLEGMPRSSSVAPVQHAHETIFFWNSALAFFMALQMANFSSLVSRPVNDGMSGSSRSSQPRDDVSSGHVTFPESHFSSTLDCTIWYMSPPFPPNKWPPSPSLEGTPRSSSVASVQHEQIATCWRKDFLASFIALQMASFSSLVSVPVNDGLPGSSRSSQPREDVSSGHVIFPESHFSSTLDCINWPPAPPRRPRIMVLASTILEESSTRMVARLYNCMVIVVVWFVCEFGSVQVLAAFEFYDLIWYQPLLHLSCTYFTPKTMYYRTLLLFWITILFPVSSPDMDILEHESLMS